MKLKTLLTSFISSQCGGFLAASVTGPSPADSNGAGSMAKARALAGRYGRHLLFIALGIGVMLPAGCGAYYYGRWHHGRVLVTVPPPQPAYEYQYYYDPGVQAYYCYYPGTGWRYFPGVPPPNAVFWAGPPPVYLPPPPGVVAAPPPLSFDFYFDPVQHVYYCHDPRFGWRYFPGRPPLHARFWRGAPPRMLPHPPRGAPIHRGPGRGR